MGRREAEQGPPAERRAGWALIPGVRERGYIAVPRALLETPMWQQPREFSLGEAYLDVVFQARWCAEPKDTLTRGSRPLRLRQGECWRSYEGWAQRWGVAKSKARRMIGLLEALGYTSTRVESGQLCIEVRDYGTYLTGAAWQSRSAPGSGTGTASAEAGLDADGVFPTGERV